jgi:hypothetical protein
MKKEGTGRADDRSGVYDRLCGRRRGRTLRFENCGSTEGRKMTGSAEPPAPSAAAKNDLLRLDYQQTIGLLAGIGDVRFKLLALVPTLSGAAVAVLGRPSSNAELLAVGAIGLIATLGVLLYELRNTQLYDYGLGRAQMLERELGFGSTASSGSPGGLFSDRPGRTLRLFGVLPVDRDAGLSLVYSAAIAGWTYLLAWGALHALGIGHARAIGGTIGVAAGLLLLLELTRARAE